MPCQERLVPIQALSLREEPLPHELEDRWILTQKLDSALARCWLSPDPYYGGRTIAMPSIA